MLQRTNPISHLTDEEFVKQEMLTDGNYLTEEDLFAGNAISYPIFIKSNGSKFVYKDHNVEINRAKLVELWYKKIHSIIGVNSFFVEAIKTNILKMQYVGINLHELKSQSNKNPLLIEFFEKMLLSATNQIARIHFHLPNLYHGDLELFNIVTDGFFAYLIDPEPRIHIKEKEGRTPNQEQIGDLERLMNSEESLQERIFQVYNQTYKIFSGKPRFRLDTYPELVQL